MAKQWQCQGVTQLEGRATFPSVVALSLEAPSIQTIKTEFYHFHTSFFLHFSQCLSKGNFRKRSLF